MPESENREYFYSTVLSMLEGVAGLAPERQQEKLQQLVSNYGPQLSGCLMRKFGVSADDAAETVQQFLLARLLMPLPEQNLAGQFLTAQRDQPQLRFRNYLRRSLYNFYIDQQRRRQLPVVQVEDLEYAAGNHAESEHEELCDDASWANHLLNRACHAVQQECYLRNQANMWKVFYQRILRPIETGEPAVGYVELCEKGLAPTPGQAANLLQTVIRKFNRVLKELVAGYLPCDEESLPGAVNQELDDLQRALATPHALDLSVVTDFSVGADSIPASERTHLFQMSDDVASLWTDADLSALWNSLISKSVRQILQELSGNDCNSDQGSDLNQTLRQVINDPHPSLAVLTLLKDVAKRSAAQRGSHRRTSENEDVFPPSVTMVLYGLAIGLARLRCHQRISSDDDGRFIPRVCRLLEYAWIDAPTRDVLQQWLKVLEQ